MNKLRNNQPAIFVAFKITSVLKNNFFNLYSFLRSDDHKHRSGVKQETRKVLLKKGYIKILHSQILLFFNLIFHKVNTNKILVINSIKARSLNTIETDSKNGKEIRCVYKISNSFEVRYIVYEYTAQNN